MVQKVKLYLAAMVMMVRLMTLIACIIPLGLLMLSMVWSRPVPIHTMLMSATSEIPPEDSVSCNTNQQVN